MRTIKDPKTGVISVVISTDYGQKTISTGVSNMDDAKKVIKEAKVKELETAAKAAKLTRNVISQILVGKKVTVEQAIQQWLDWMLTVRKSRHTVRNHECSILDWARSQKVLKLSPSAINETNIDPWINDPKSVNKLGHRKGKLAAVRGFFDFCSIKGYCAGDPSQLVRIDMNNLTHEQKETRERKAFSDAAVKLLLENTDGFWHAAIAISRWSGLRIGDIAQLEWSSFSKPGRMVVWTDKRDRRVELEMSPQLVKAVARIEYKHKLYCFPEERELMLDLKKRAALSVQFGRICKKLDLLGHSFHDLRVTYATECWNKGIPMPHISMRLGHASVKTTDLYVKKPKGALPKNEV